MNAYIDALEVTLEQAARRKHRNRAKTARPRRTLRLASAGAAAAVLAVLTVVLVLQGGKAEPAKAAPLPLFARAATDITGRARQLPPSMRKGFDLHQARTFETAKGTGYLIPSSNGASLCMVIPDPPAGYGGTCATVADIQRRGLIGELVAPAPNAGRTQVFVVQPDGVPAPMLRDAATGKATSLTVRDGISTAIITRRGKLTVAGRDDQRTITVRPYEPEGGIVMDCGHGRLVETRDWKDTSVSGKAALCARRYPDG
jgi:hypothetical protein